MKLTGAEIVAHVLMEQEVDTLFGYPGGSVLDIYDALYKHRDKITHYITAHEQGAAHAADGYARASGKTGVVLATSGPGATNLVTGIATAYMDSVPMVAITGNVESALLGTDAFQEVYTVGITMPITKHNYMVSRAEDIAPTLREAFSIASSGRKGPVLVDITKDAGIQTAEYEPKKPLEEAKILSVSDEDIQALVDWVQQSECPIAVVGGGTISSGASGILYDLLHKMNIPAVHTLMASGVMGCDDELNLGLVGMHGNFTANKALEMADLVLTVGFRFSDRAVLNTGRFSKDVRIIQVDIDPSEVGKNMQPHHAVVGDINLVLQKAFPMLQPAQHTQWLAQISEWRKEDYVPKDSTEFLRPHQIVQIAAELAGTDAIFTTDVGQHQMWAAQYCRRTLPRSFLTSGSLGTMGYGYGAAIGAQLAMPTRKVLHFTGDASFHMNMNEACTAVTYKLPIISIVMNNNALGMVRQWQEIFYEGRYSASVPQRLTDYKKVAEGFGLAGYRATTPEEFKAAMQMALKEDGPAWIECVIDREEMVSPMIPAGKSVADTIIF